jgi:hypothetical protein
VTEPPLVDLASLSPHVDQRVRVRGRVSRIPWQHMTAYAPDTDSEYFDGENGGQIMVYVPRSLAPLAPDALIELTGTVFTVSGPAKHSRPDEPTHTEHSLLVEAWTPV